MCSAFWITFSLDKLWNGFSRAKPKISHNVTANAHTVLEQVYLSWKRKLHGFQSFLTRDNIHNTRRMLSQGNHLMGAGGLPPISA